MRISIMKPGVNSRCCMIALYSERPAEFCGPLFQDGMGPIPNAPNRKSEIASTTGSEIRITAHIKV